MAADEGLGLKEKERTLAHLYDWRITRNSDVPLFMQVYQQVRSAVLSQALRPCTRLPSTRELASQLSISRSVVISAYEHLLAEGYLTGKVGSGTYVSSELFRPATPARAKRASRAFPSNTSNGLASVGDFVDVTLQNNDRPFNLGRTLIDSRTREVWRKLTARVFRSIDPDHLGYSDPRGLPRLRNAICDYVRAARGVRCEPDQIVVTAGTQHAIDLVIRLLRERDAAAWVEDPCYSLTLQALLAAGIKVHAIPVDEHGIDVGAGIRKAPKARAVFVTPSHQFPTGVALSMGRRLELIAWARQTSAWIVEDDYSSEFRYGGRPLASLQGLDEGKRVIYVGTLNKALFPGLRLGYAVLPAELLRAFVTVRYLADRQPSSLYQAVVADFIDEGHFAAHIRRMRIAYRDQRDLLVEGLRRELGRETAVDPPDQGMHLVLQLTKNLSDVAVERGAFEVGVVARAMSRLYIEAPPRSALLLGFSGYPLRAIPAAVKRLAKVIQKRR